MRLRSSKNQADSSRPRSYLTTHIGESSKGTLTQEWLRYELLGSNPNGARPVNKALNFDRLGPVRAEFDRLSPTRILPEVVAPEAQRARLEVGASKAPPPPRGRLATTGVNEIS
ncbi:hypothetical protein QYF36_014568 [Acer negundo]|nr:hypothetical protein QYF36_014568 [Acer negundo]